MFGLVICSEIDAQIMLIGNLMDPNNAEVCGTWRRACCRIMVSVLETFELVGAELGERAACCCSLCSISWYSDKLLLIFPKVKHRYREDSEQHRF